MNEERAKALVESLLPMQKSGQHFPCPRCGEDCMDPQLLHNSMSRYADVYICNDCGMDEALRDMAKRPKPLSKWSMSISFAGEEQRGDVYV